MRILVTGAAGFVGRWLVRELSGGGHEVTGYDREDFDITDWVAVRDAVERDRPEAVIHLAGIAYPPAATEHPDEAFRVNVGGTTHLLEALRASEHPAATLVVGSAEAYGVPEPSDLPLTEDSPLRPSTPYALSKLAQEAVAIEYAARFGLPVVVARPFNQIGPGQLPPLAVPSLAQRVAAYASRQSSSIAVGNLDVRRDFTDVRDAVQAYRLLVEALDSGRLERGGGVFVVASGRSVAIRQIVETFCRLAGVVPRTEVDPDLVRAGEAAEMRGDAAALRALTGWQPTRSIEETLADTWAEVVGNARPA